MKHSLRGGVLHSYLLQQHSVHARMKMCNQTLSTRKQRIITNRLWSLKPSILSNKKKT